MTCADVQELAPELALDLLTGAERAAALAHLAGCAACRSEVASLTDVGEAMLAIAPEVPPSAGFESRVISRISALGAGGGAGAAGRPVEPVDRADPLDRADPVDSADRPSRGRGGWHRGPRRRVVAAAAAVILAVVAVAAALVVGSEGDAGDGDVVAAADLRTASGRVVGEATLRDGDPAVVTVEMGDWVEHLRRYGDSDDHSYWLTVGAAGESAETYALPVSEPGPWHVSLDADESASAVTSVAVVDESGHTWCDARFTR